MFAVSLSVFNCQYCLLKDLLDPYSSRKEETGYLSKKRNLKLLCSFQGIPAWKTRQTTALYKHSRSKDFRTYAWVNTLCNVCTVNPAFSRTMVLTLRVCMPWKLPNFPKSQLLCQSYCVVIPKGLNDGQGLWGNELFQIAMNSFEFCSIVQSWGKIFQTWKQDRRVWFTSHLPLPFLATL